MTTWTHAEQLAEASPAVESYSYPCDDGSMEIEWIDGEKSKFADPQAAVNAMRTVDAECSNDTDEPIAAADFAECTETPEEAEVLAARARGEIADEQIREAGYDHLLDD